MTLTGIAVLAGAVAVFAYVLVVGGESEYTFAKDSDSWADFGAYLGGVLGPAFAFLAFVGVLLTVWLQAKSLEALEQQGYHREAQRVLSVVSERIDVLLSKYPAKPMSHPRLQGEPLTVFTIISGAGTASLRKSDDYIVEATNARFVADAKISLRSEAVAIGLELNQLAWLLGQYKAVGGAKIVTEYYMNRYSAVVCWLNALGFLDAHPEVNKCFDIELLRKVFSSDDVK